MSEMKYLTTTLFTLAVMFGAPAAAQQQQSYSLSFVSPTGTAGPTDTIPLYLRLTASAGNTEPLFTDGSGYVISGYDFSGYMGPPSLSDPNTRTNLNAYFSCSDTFTGGCNNGGAYTFSFNFDPPNLIGPNNFSLAPGASFEWLFVTFTPVGGQAAPGTYRFYNSGAIIDINNFGDPATTADDQNQSIILAQTCADGDNVCAFTRVVAGPAAVPEPVSWALMIIGFGAVGTALRRRRATSAVTPDLRLPPSRTVARHI